MGGLYETHREVVLCKREGTTGNGRVFLCEFEEVFRQGKEATGKPMCIEEVDAIIRGGGHCQNSGGIRCVR